MKASINSRLPVQEVEPCAALAHRPLDVVQHQLSAGSVLVVVRQVGDVKKAIIAYPVNSDLERDGHFVDAQRGDFHLAKRRVISTCW